MSLTAFSAGLAFFTLVSVSDMTVPPRAGKTQIEPALPAKGYGFEWFLVNEGEPEEGHNQLI